MNLSEEEFSEWEGLKWRHYKLQRLWRANMKNKQRLNTMKREDALVSMVKRLQEFSEVVHEHRTHHDAAGSGGSACGSGGSDRYA